MHLIAWKLIIKVSFWHKLGSLYVLNGLLICVIYDYNLELKHCSIIYYATFLSNSFRPFDFNMIVFGGENVPNLFGDCDKVIILLLFLVNDCIQEIKLIKRDLIETFIFSKKIEVDFPRMFFPNLFMFFLILLTQVVVSYIFFPILKPLGADDIAVV